MGSMSRAICLGDGRTFAIGEGEDYRPTLDAWRGSGDQ
jgi:hypothetical protein